MATFVMQSLGAEVAALNTVQFSKQLQTLQTHQIANDFAR